MTPIPSKLNTQPTSDVTVIIQLLKHQNDRSKSPSSVVFGSGNYSTAQTNHNQLTHDDEDDGDVNTTITNAISSSDSGYAALVLGNQTLSLTIVC